MVSHIEMSVLRVDGCSVRQGEYRGTRMYLYYRLMINIDKYTTCGWLRRMPTTANSIRNREFTERDVIFYGHHSFPKTYTWSSVVCYAPRVEREEQLEGISHRWYAFTTSGGYPAFALQVPGAWSTT